MLVNLFNPDGSVVLQLQLPVGHPLPTVVRLGPRFFLHGSLANPARDGAHSLNFYEVVGYDATVR